jgi:hypothetical protein
MDLTHMPRMTTAIILLLAITGCSTIPQGTIKQAIEGRVHRDPQHCPVQPQTIIIISKGMQNEA